MPITQALNSKGNIKKFSNEDIPFSASSPVIASYYATSTLSQTVINLSFSVDTTNPDVFWLFVDGKKLDAGSTNDYIFSNIAPDGTSSQVTLEQALPANLNIQAYKLGLKKESEFLTDNRFVSLYSEMAQGFQAYVDNTSNLIAATATAGTPVAGTFYSTINNRASIMDLSQDLRARMGVERFMTQQLLPVYGESGPNGEMVWSTPNDSLGRVRFVGNWDFQNQTSGARPRTASSGDYVEFTFYGTGLNIVNATNQASMDARASTDGGVEGANLFVASYSTVLDGRNYPANQPTNVVTGLTLGVHTVKIRNNTTVALNVFGFEILNESSNVLVQPGIAYNSGKQVITTAQSSASYSALVTGTRGGRVLVYQNASGTIGSAFQATNASQANLTSATHANEEMVKQINWREFSAGRADDFGNVTTAAVSRAYGIDDDVTNLIGATVNTNVAFTVFADSVSLSVGTANFVIFQFVGTGLDLMVVQDGNTGRGFGSISIDGAASIGTYTSTAASGLYTLKIVSGLPYGTHTVKITNSSASLDTPGIHAFRVYQPKKPTLPAGAMELADYNVFANYTANATAGQLTIGTGVLRKNNFREFSYTGTWTPSLNTAVITGWLIGSSTTADFFTYQFFGTGFDFRFHNNATTSTWTVSVDGSTNVSGFTNSNYGAGITSFTPSTGTLVTSASSTTGNGISISNMSLALHTVKITKTAGTGTLDNEAFDLIVPIHSYKSSLFDVVQNTITVGSNGISDNRVYSPIKNLYPGRTMSAFAMGVTSGPSTTSTALVPLADLAVAIKTSGGDLAISFDVQFTNGSIVSNSFAIYIDGVQVNIQVASPAGAGSSVGGSGTFKVNPGNHIVEIFWAATGGGTLSSGTTNRHLYVKEV